MSECANFAPWFGYGCALKVSSCMWVCVVTCEQHGELLQLFAASTGRELRRVKCFPLRTSNLQRHFGKMAAALRAALFPFSNIATMVFSSTLGKSDMKAPTPWATLPDHIAVVAGTAPKLVVAIVSWLLLLRYDVLSAATTYSWAWMQHIVVRDLVITLLGAGFWEWLLYADWSPFKAKLKARKFNPEYPPMEHVRVCCGDIAAPTFCQLFCFAPLYFIASLRAGVGSWPEPGRVGFGLVCLFRSGSAFGGASSARSLRQPSRYGIFINLQRFGRDNGRPPPSRWARSRGWCRCRIGGSCTFTPSTA